MSDATVSAVKPLPPLARPKIVSVVLAMPRARSASPYAAAQVDPSASSMRTTPENPIRSATSSIASPLVVMEFPPPKKTTGYGRCRTMWQEDRVAKTSGRPTLTSIVGETVAEVSPAKRHGLGRGGPALLKQVPLFANLSARHLKKLASRCEVVRYPVNRTVVGQGARGDSFFVIADGTAAVKKGTRTIGTLGPGDFFG